MTVVKKLWESQGEEPKKKIEFVYIVDGIKKPYTTMNKPSEYDHVYLLLENSNGFDLFYAYNLINGEPLGAVYLGFFNDGVV